MTITIPFWLLVLIGIPVALVLLAATGIGLFFLWHAAKGNLRLFR